MYRRTSERSSSGAQDSCFDLIGSHQLRIPCSTRSGTDELNLMTMKGHQIRSNSAYGAEHKVAVHNKKTRKNGKFPFTTFGGTVKSNQEGGNLTIHGRNKTNI